MSNKFEIKSFEPSRNTFIVEFYNGDESIALNLPMPVKPSEDPNKIEFHEGEELTKFIEAFTPDFKRNEDLAKADASYIQSLIKPVKRDLDYYKAYLDMQVTMFINESIRYRSDGTPGYDSLESTVIYLNSSNEQWSKEAKEIQEWAIETWEKAFSEFKGLENQWLMDGVDFIDKIDKMISELPKFYFE